MGELAAFSGLAFSEAVNAFPPRNTRFPRQFPRIPSLTAAELITVSPRAFPPPPTAFPAPSLAARQPPRALALTWPHALAGPGRHGPAGTDQGHCDSRWRQYHAAADPAPGNRPGSGRTQGHARSAQPRTSSRRNGLRADLVRGPSVVAAPVRGRPCKADGPPHRSLAPIPVRYASVDTAI